MKKFTQKFSAGFTVVEALVSIAILSLSIAATFSAVQSGLHDSILAKNRVTAFYLAQEAMEIVRNVRDANALTTNDGASTNWLATLSVNSDDPCYFGNYCVVDAPNNYAAVCPVATSLSSCAPLLESPTNGLFGYNVRGGPTADGLPSIFTRAVKFTSISADEVEVTVTIKWITSGKTQLFTVTEDLLNHQ